MYLPRYESCFRKLCFVSVLISLGLIFLYKWVLPTNSITGVFTSSPMAVTYSTVNPLPTLDPNWTLDLIDNYFQTARRQSNDKLIINTDKCKIPDIDLWVPEIMKLVKNVTQRCVGKLKLTYVDYQNVIINQVAFENLNRTLQNLKCCYRTVYRVEQTMKKHNHSADSLFRYSKSCYLMSWITQPVSGYIMVNCTAKNKAKEKIIYLNFHALAKLSQQEEKQLSPKFQYWQKYRANTLLQNGSRTKSSKPEGKVLPPNVLLLGIDSTSRMNFYRFMNKTKKALDQLGVVEMNGYTKVGDNTCPNFKAIMGTKPLLEIDKSCVEKNWDPQNPELYLWHQFSKQKYITGHFEDSPKMAIFNYVKTGFVQAPTDFYNRPWMYAAYTELTKKKKAVYSIDCLGYQRSEEVLLKYNLDLMTMVTGKQTPYFITTWLTDLTHGNLNKVQTMDGILAEILLKMFKNRLLDNTILFLISDHGYRYGSIRTTASGWFEMKLPMMFVHIPEKVRQRFPSWSTALKHNSDVLTSPFDLHETLKEILRISNPSFSQAAPPTGHSLFQKIPARNCDEANVPTEYCACYPETQTKLNIAVVQMGALRLVDNLNEGLPKNCSKLRIHEVMSAVVVKEIQTEKSSITEYSIGLKVSPRGFTFEGTVTYDNVLNNVTKVSGVQRTNKKDEPTDCLTESENKFELFCHCKK